MNFKRQFQILKQEASAYELMLSTRVQLHEWIGNVLITIIASTEDIPIFLLASRLSKQEIPFCFWQKRFSVKASKWENNYAFRRQITWSVMAWQHTVLISTHMWITQVLPTRQITVGLRCGCYCNRIQDSMFEEASAAIKTAFRHTVWPVVWLHLYVTDKDGLKFIIII